MNFSDWYAFIEAIEGLTVVLLVSFIHYLHTAK